LKVDFEVFSDLFVNKVVVRHEDDVSPGRPIFHCIVWAEHLLLGLDVQLLDVLRFPGDCLLSSFSILEVHTGVDAFLHLCTAGIEGETTVHVDG